MSQAHRFGTQSVYCLGAPQQKKGPVTLWHWQCPSPKCRGGDHGVKCM